MSKRACTVQKKNSSRIFPRRRLCVYHPESKFRKGLFRAWMPVAKAIKGRNDRKFFRDLKAGGGGLKGGRKWRRRVAMLAGAISAGLAANLVLGS